MNSAPWLCLILTLPAAQPALRMRLWRSLKARGCAMLRDGVYLLPERSGAGETLAQVAEEANAGGGNAQVVNLGARDEGQEQAWRDLFDRSADYAGLLNALAAARRSLKKDTAAAERSLRRLRRDFENLSAVDFFPGAAQAQAQAALEEAEALLERQRSPGEPSVSMGSVECLDPKSHRGRIWASRARPWVDRLASAWLIKKKIDPKARFLWLGKPSDCPREALGFDFDGARFTHVGALVTFEVLAASFGLDGDAAIRRLGELVHFLDVGGVPVPEAAGVSTLLGAMRERITDDDLLVKETGRLFDDLYQSFQLQEPA